MVVVGAGQSGLAAARALRALDVPTLVLEASGRPAGSWPDYYDSLRLFSPVEFSSMQGMAFPGEPGRYPDRDEVADYLERYAMTLDVEIVLDTQVETIHGRDRGFLVTAADGRSFAASGVVAASGSFTNPYRPTFEGEAGFTAELSHVAEYRSPGRYEGRRVVVVGAGDSAAQVATELARLATVTIATRQPPRFIPQHLHGRDVHHWFRTTGFDALPPAWLRTLGHGAVITDSVGFAQTLADGLLDRRPMFLALDGDEVVWGDGARERVDAIILATGYRPSLGYLRDLGALDPEGMPMHVGGISTTHAGLVYVGLEYQRSFASNTLRGVSHDAEFVAEPLAAWVRDAPTAVGVSDAR